VAECVPEYLNVLPHNKRLLYEDPKNISYQAYLTDAGCYICDDTDYEYEWDKDDLIPPLVDFNPLFSTASTTSVDLNSNWAIGSLGIRATSTDAGGSGKKLFKETDLTILANCGLYNDITNPATRETKCLASQFNCCWDAVAESCLNSGSPICYQPFVKNVACRPSVTLGSPSPVASSTNIMTDSLIYMEFAKSNAPVDMDVDTYLNGLEIYECTDGSGDFDNTFCGGDLYDSYHFATSTFSNSVVSYDHDPLIVDEWYKIVATTTIQDAYGFELQPKEWHFKVGAGICTPSYLEVSPANWTMDTGIQKKYSTFCYDNQCNVCENDYDYFWDSDPSGIANVTPDTPNVTAKVIGTNFGDTQIIAKNLDVIDPDTLLPLEDFGQLTVTTTNSIPPNPNPIILDRPRVKMQPCVNTYSSSPSPFPDNDDVPIDPVIHVDFEYPDGTVATMDPSTYPAVDNVLYKCSEAVENSGLKSTKGGIKSSLSHSYS